MVSKLGPSAPQKLRKMVDLNGKWLGIKMFQKGPMIFYWLTSSKGAVRLALPRFAESAKPKGRREPPKLRRVQVDDAFDILGQQLGSLGTGLGCLVW